MTWDFPSSPTLGQTYETPDGAIYVCVDATNVAWDLVPKPELGADQITGLPDGVALTGTDVLALVQSNSAVKSTMSNVLTYISSNLGTPAFRTLLDDADAATMATSIGVGASNSVSFNTVTTTSFMRSGSYIDIGSGQATGGGAVARIGHATNRLQIVPTNLAGSFQTNKELTFDPDGDAIWTVEGGLIIPTGSSLRVDSITDAGTGFIAIDEPVFITHGTVGTDTTVLTLRAATEGSTDQYTAYVGLDFAVTGAENTAGDIPDGVIAAIRAGDLRPLSTSFEDAGIMFFSTDSVVSTLHRTGHIGRRGVSGTVQSYVEFQLAGKSDGQDNTFAQIDAYNEDAASGAGGIVARIAFEQDEADTDAGGIYFQAANSSGAITRKANIRNDRVTALVPLYVDDATGSGTIYIRDTSGAAAGGRVTGESYNGIALRAGLSGFTNLVLCRNDTNAVEAYANGVLQGRYTSAGLDIPNTLTTGDVASGNDSGQLLIGGGLTSTSRAFLQLNGSADDIRTRTDDLQLRTKGNVLLGQLTTTVLALSVPIRMEEGREADSQVTVADGANTSIDMTSRANFGMISAIADGSHSYSAFFFYDVGSTGGGVGIQLGANTELDGGTTPAATTGKLTYYMENSGNIHIYNDSGVSVTIDLYVFG